MLKPTPNQPANRLDDVRDWETNLETRASLQMIPPPACAASINLAVWEERGGPVERAPVQLVLHVSSRF